MPVGAIIVPALLAGAYVPTQNRQLALLLLLIIPRVNVVNIEGYRGIRMCFGEME